MHDPRLTLSPADQWKRLKLALGVTASHQVLVETVLRMDREALAERRAMRPGRKPATRLPRKEAAHAAA